MSCIPGRIDVINEQALSDNIEAITGMENVVLFVPNSTKMRNDVYVQARMEQYDHLANVLTEMIQKRIDSEPFWGDSNMLSYMNLEKMFESLGIDKEYIKEEYGGTGKVSNLAALSKLNV